MLETAREIARELGTDALTLGALAERAGVSKPIAYSHFESRSGLMIALYKEINDRQIRDQQEALKRQPAELDEVAHVMAQAYMDCYAAVGPEWHAIGAALKGDAQMEAYQREMVDGHVEFYRATLAPLSPLSNEQVRRRCIAIIGAAEALSQGITHGCIGKDDAVTELTSLITTWLR